MSRLRRPAEIGSLLLATIVLVLALTIPVTAPVFALTIVRTAASEWSPYLVGLGVVSLIPAWLSLRGTRRRSRRLAVIALVEAPLGIAIAAMPIAQLPLTTTRAEQALRDAVGGDVAMGAPARAGAIAETRDITFRTVGTTALRLDRYDPPFPGPHPGVVVVHGGGWSAGRKSGSAAAPMDRYLAGRGYVVYDIEYRLAPAFTFPSALEDVQCALGYVRAHGDGNVDPERVALMGRSAGAHLALLAAYRAARDPVPSGCDRPASVRAVIAYYPPTDLMARYREPMVPDLVRARPTLERFLGGTPDQMPDRYRSATVQSWLDLPVPPTLLIHGEADQIERPGDSIGPTNALRAVGQRVGLILVPFGAHDFDGVPGGLREGLITETVERFLASLLGRT